MTEAERLLRRLEWLSVPEPNSGCHLWLGDVNGDGYPVFSTPLLKTKLVHRQVVILNGLWLPDWLTVDHTCRVRSCINLDHLDVASRERNSSLASSRRRR